MADPILLARHGGESCFLLPGMANRHGLITGATGTGKTVTLQKLAESFSHMGVPVFLADVKGDLTGISQSGHIEGKLAATLEERGLPVPEGRACPVTLWDVFGAQGHPVRATISDMGPLLLGRMLGLNDTQAGVLNIVFKIADDSGLLLLDAKDLRARAGCGQAGESDPQGEDHGRARPRQRRLPQVQAGELGPAPPGDDQRHQREHERHVQSGGRSLAPERARGQQTEQGQRRHGAGDDGVGREQGPRADGEAGTGEPGHRPHEDVGDPGRLDEQQAEGRDEASAAERVVQAREAVRAVDGCYRQEDRFQH